jgi:nitroimidazol reductase NimA-like FMN-containing flavoprotein (pyridoxamine 5'-phosphate oxidase superfamily)
MTVEQQTAMTDAETDALLGRRETGVLSLARDDEPYAVPISYGYDASARKFVMRLVSTPDGEKERFLTDSPQVRFVVYEEDGTTYRSVVANGRLELVPRSELTTDHVERFGAAKRPLFEMWDETRADLDIRLYELDPDELSGRRIDVD